MDRIKFEQLITDSMKSIFGFALTRLGNTVEAEYLASDILYEIIRSAKNLKDETRFYGFMWRIAENVCADYLRKKSRHASRMAELNETIADESAPALVEIIQKEDVNLLRRELSLLSKQYREATVLYYVENLSCSEVASRLHISTEMVKYYLFRARKMIREGMNMERLFGEKSYHPSGFEIDYWGTSQYNPVDYADFENRKIKGNILLSAYYSPITMQELSIELGVALPYLEDEIKLLVDRQYLICKNGKYLTNIPIFTVDCTATIDKKLQEITENTARKIVAVADKFDSCFGNRFANENLARWQKILICLHFSLMETEKSLATVYEKSSENRSGAVWGRSFESSTQGELPQGIQGIYNGCPSNDKRGSVIAMNFKQTLYAQHFEFGMTDAVVCAAADCLAFLPKDWQQRLDELAYTKGDKANFAVWTMAEYEELREILSESVSAVSELSRKTSKAAAGVTADLAPSHISKTAEYVGALVYRFRSIENLVNVLFDMGWLKAVDDKEKPAICVVMN